MVVQSSKNWQMTNNFSFVQRIPRITKSQVIPVMWVGSLSFAAGQMSTKQYFHPQMYWKSTLALLDLFPSVKLSSGQRFLILN